MNTIARRGTVRWAHNLAAAAHRSLLVQALQYGGRRSAPARLCLEAALAQRDGEIDRSLSLFRRALVVARGFDNALVIDLLVPLCVSRNYLDEAEGLLQTSPEHPLLRAARGALAAVCLARRGEGKAARELRAEVDRLDPGESALIAGSVLQRLALSSFYSHDHNQALDYAKRSVLLYEVADANRLLAGSHSIAYAIHHDVMGDVSEARLSAGRIVTAGERGGDAAFIALGTVALYEIAAETSDEDQLWVLRKMLRARARPEIFQERFPELFADAAPQAWRGEFESFLMAVQHMADEVATTAGMKAFCAALESLALLGTGRDALARRASRRSFHLIGRAATGAASAAESRYRRLARALAASTCLILAL